MTVYAEIKILGRESHIEDFEVSSLENAEIEVKEVVQNFNDTLRPGEGKRKFICLCGDPDKDMKDNLLDIDLKNIFLF